MKLYQLFYLPNERYAAVLTVVAVLAAVTFVDWTLVSASLLWEGALSGLLTLVVFVTTVAAINLVARLWVGDWLVDARDPSVDRG